MTDTIKSAPDGMTLRDWFSGQVDATNIVEFNSPEDAASFLGEECPSREDTEAMIALTLRLQAKLRYMFADAMLEYSERESE